MADTVFGNRLRDLRRECHMTQQEVADHLRIHRTTYTKYESGVVAPDHQALVTLAQVFGVSVDTLLGCESPADPDDLSEGAGELVRLSLQEKMLVQLYRQLDHNEQQILQKQIQSSFNQKRRNEQKKG